ncbi:hypothetical protein [Streptosporangium sp. NPDC000509]|uniref:hypothetical protein n=1 Tax=Streptosporangium sp. NPDC000509 TaxID=3366186 RepID=UPI0036807D27
MDDHSAGKRSWLEQIVIGIAVLIADGFLMAMGLYAAFVIGGFQILGGGPDRTQAELEAHQHRGSLAIYGSATVVALILMAIAILAWRRRPEITFVQLISLCALGLFVADWARVNPW